MTVIVKLAERLMSIDAVAQLIELCRSGNNGGQFCSPCEHEIAELLPKRISMFNQMLRKLLGFPQKEFTILLPINIMCDKLRSQSLVF